MTKVYLVEDARVIPSIGESADERVPLLRPIRAALILLDAPTTDEWPLDNLPPESLAVALRPQQARKLGQQLLVTARKLEKKRRR